MGQDRHWYWNAMGKSRHRHPRFARKAWRGGYGYIQVIRIAAGIQGSSRGKKKTPRKQENNDTAERAAYSLHGKTS